ncbi:hypothetical protein D3C81_1165000 [compost metagenome]
MLDAFEFVEFDGFLRGDPLPAQELVDLPAAKRGPVIADKGRPGDRVAPVRAGHRGGHQQLEGLLQQRAPFQFRGQRIGRPDHDGDVNLAGVDLPEQVERDAGHHAHTAVRQFRPERRNGIGQEGGLRGGDGPDAHHARALDIEALAADPLVQHHQFLGQRQRFAPGGVQAG